MGKRDYSTASAANRIIENTYIHYAKQLFFSTQRDKINVVFYKMSIHCLNLSYFGYIALILKAFVYHFFMCTNRSLY